jgi:hypothetical protein
LAPGLRQRDLDFSVVGDKPDRTVGARGRGAIDVQQLFEKTIGGVAGQANLPQDASEHVDEKGIPGAIDVAVCSAGERYPKMKFWRGHEGRFYSERRSNSTRARAQSLAI